MRDGSDDSPETPREWIRWFRTTDEGAVVFLREALSGVAIVALVGLVLFAVSGLWPPMVAIESDSMAPHMRTGDLVFVMDEDRLVPDAAHADTGVVTHLTGRATGYSTFQRPGDVMVYEPDGRAGVTPIIHRARFWVNESENWYRKADPAHVGAATSCADLRHCPAPHAGFVTKGDNNTRYDQVGVDPISTVVKPAWVVGTAEFRVPWLGHVRLLAGQAVVGDAGTLRGAATDGGADGAFPAATGSRGAASPRCPVD
jgi:signal peptidase